MHIHKRHNIYPGKPSRGRKPNKNFLIINSLYNVQEITQTNIDSPLQEMCHSSPSLQLVIAACLIRERASELCVRSEALASYLYKTGTCEGVSLAGPTSHSGWVNPPLINSGSSIITVGADFLFCPL
jgi:hypothetical protein